MAPQTSPASIADKLTAHRNALYALPSRRPGAGRPFDDSWDLYDPDGYSLREIEPGHWHVVAGPGVAGWMCTGKCTGLSWLDVVTRFATRPAEQPDPFSRLARQLDPRWTYLTAWLLPGECLEDGCPFINSRHQHKTPAAVAP